jgi:hypothetical protein
MTSNTDHNESNPAGNADTTSEAKKMSEVLPLVSRRLKQQGVARVHARYEGSQIMLAFLGADDIPRGSISIVTSVMEISRVFDSILERRYPGDRNRDNVSGYFRWDLNADTVEHEHIVTHHGL